ncbi:MAG: DUF2252 family protein [Nitrosospira sp.]
MKNKSRLPAPGAREAILAECRNRKMARSVHAFVRGNPTHFYEWLDGIKGRKLLQGPAIWIGGDCHVGNLGPVANAQGEIDIQIRDFDQAVIGNPAHDLIRLGLSLATAARDSDLAGVVTSQMMEQLMAGYERCFDEKTDVEEAFPDAATINVTMKKATRRSWKDLANESIDGTAPRIPLGKKFWPLSKEERKGIERIFEKETVLCHAIPSDSGNGAAVAKVLDAAYWIKGCSSLGKLRYAVLLDIEHSGSQPSYRCLMDIKEAPKAAAPRQQGVRMPHVDGERVVEGARNLSPYLGDRMIAAQISHRSVFVRELLPQDMKIEIKRIMQDEARKVAKYLAMVVGKAHARQMDAATRKRWKKELEINRAKTDEAPSWLWSSVLELVALHEGHYLEHARNYALQGNAAT